MYRGLVTFFGVVVLSIGCLAQASLSRDSALSSGDQEPGVRVSSRQPPERSISVVRLRVPRKVRELYEKAGNAFRKHNYVEAQGKLNQALEQYPEFPEALTLSGFIRLDLNQWESAEQNLQAAVRSDPTYGEAFLILGDLYNRQRRFNDACAALEHAVVLIPDYWPVHYELARALIGEQQYELALENIDPALRANRGTLLHVAKAHALIGLGRYSDAAAELHTYLHYQPSGDGAQDAAALLNKLQASTGR